ncbi:MAG: homoserine dehydrogenase [Bacteroidia bacterium]|jgi:homoserine dehydrogenase
MQNKLHIGLFGFGCVGHGLYHVLQQSSGIPAEITKVCIKNPGKKRDADPALFTTHKLEILNDPLIQVVVELIDDADEAYAIVKAALLNGKAVVTANKKMMAEHFNELYELQQSTGIPILYEGAVCGAIPIIRSLEEYYDNDTVNAIRGIFNGTSNYILTKTMEENRTFKDVLKEAQQLGFAETNPALDIQATDAKYKLIILMAHAFGIVVKPDQVLNIGIEHLHVNDLLYARENGYVIKQVPQVYKSGSTLHAYVLPQLISERDGLSRVNNEFNAVQVNATFLDHQTFFGRGAGSLPTGAAVLSDVSALTYHYRYGYKKLKQDHGLTFSNNTRIKAYIRFNDAEDLNLLQVKHIEETYRSKTHNYVIGEVEIARLMELNLNERSYLFIARIGEVESTDSPNESFGLKELLESDLVLN